MDNRDIRRLTRECAMQYLFETGIQKEYSESLKSVFLSRLSDLRDYEEKKFDGTYPIEADFFNKVINAVEENITEIDTILESAAENWRIDRISKVDLAILRLSIAEILYIEDVPESVSINEAVELAKIFGNESSGKFVNGVLGRVAKEKKIRDEK